MNDELAILANDELRELNGLVDSLCIPDAILRDCLTAGFFVTLLKREGAEYLEKFEKSSDDFDRLCNAAPHVSRECLRMLSMAYTSIVFFFEDRPDEQSVRSGAMMLISAATAKGAAIALLPTSVEYFSAKVQADRKAALSEAGRQGALVRLQPYAKLKEWALEKGEKLGASKDVARRLAAQLPEHLSGISDDPGRLIYEVLREKNKPH